MSKNLLLQRQQDDSMMDIGQNCSQCRTLDFLPFRCEYCNLIFCADHRRLADHHCPYLSKLESQNIRPKSPQPLNGQTAASLFPDREKDRAKIDKLIDKPYKPTSIIETSFRVGDVKTKNAFSKLTKFLSLQKTKDTKMKKLFAKKTSPAVELLLLRKLAKGDNKIPAADRVYVWCLFVDANEEEEEKLTKIDPQKHRVAVFVNKNWPIGRALDFISDELRIKNKNNQTNDISERLNIFKLQKDVPILLLTSSRCKDVVNGDVLYLVRGNV